MSVEALAVGVADEFVIGGLAHGSFPSHSLLSDVGTGYLAAYEKDGSLSWIRKVGSPTGTSTVQAITHDVHGSILATYTTSNTVGNLTPVGGVDIFLMKLSPFGEEIWTVSIGSQGEDISHAVETLDNFIYLAGSSEGDIGGQSQIGDKDILIAKYDDTGQLIWHKIMGSTSDDHASDIEIDSRGNAYVSADTKGAFPGNTAFGNTDALVLKIDKDGNLLWSRQFGSSVEETSFGICRSLDGYRVYATGLTMGSVGNAINDMSFGNYYVTVLDANGDINSIDTYGSNAVDFSYDVMHASNGVFYIAGMTNGSVSTQGHFGSYDLFFQTLMTPLILTATVL